MRRIWRLVHYVRPYALYSLAHQFSVPDQRNAHIGVQTEGGTTSLANDPDFQIGYPDATITSILPTLTAGQITTVTITGTNLGDVPQIFVNDPANGVRIVGAPFQASADHTSILVNVQVDAGVSPETATFTLYPQYSGYGNGFVSGNPGGVDGAASGVDSVEVPAHIVNFRQTAGYDAGQGVLHFDYAWDSSTGHLSDLSGCYIEEVVTYRGPNPFPWPSPPYGPQTMPGDYPNNPTTKGGPATGGAAPDDHSPPRVGFLKPYQGDTTISSQTYHYRCSNYNGGQWNDLMTNIMINRQVAPNFGGSWKYVITKSNVQAIIPTLP